MNVEIVSLDRNEVVLVTSNTLGYRGRFRCEVGAGPASIVPYSGREDSLVEGERVDVETGQQSVSEFEIVPPERAPGMRELDRPGDYAVTGTVDVVVGQVIEIDVGGLAFAVDTEESGGVVPRSGERVSFHLHGLSLWCSNIW